MLLDQRVNLELPYMGVVRNSADHIINKTIFNVRIDLIIRPGVGNVYSAEKMKKNLI